MADTDGPCLCKACGEDLVKHNNLALSCDACNSWFCYTCMGVAKKIFDALNQKYDTTMVKVLCKECVIATCPINIGKSFNEMKKDVSDKITELANQITVLKTDSLLKVEESIEIMKAQTKEAKSSWANIVAMGLESSQSIRAVQDAVKLSSQEHLKCEERVRSVVMFRIPESNKDNHIDRNKDDVEFVNTFMDQGLKIQKEPIQSIYRLGRYEADKSRPVKVIFCQKAGQVKIMENLSSLSNAEESFKKLSITIDRSIEERQVIKDMIQKAKAQTENSVDKKYVVKGTFKPYIQELNKLT